MFLVLTLPLGLRVLTFSEPQHLELDFLQGVIEFLTVKRKLDRVSILRIDDMILKMPRNEDVAYTLGRLADILGKVGPGKIHLDRLSGAS